MYRDRMTSEHYTHKSDVTSSRAAGWRGVARSETWIVVVREEW